MNPYQQNVTDIAKREAIRASEMIGDKTADAATRVGGLGGYREGIIQAERERNLAQQLSDIQTKGSLGAFQSAQQQLAAERQAQSINTAIKSTEKELRKLKLKQEIWRLKKRK